MGSTMSSDSLAADSPAAPSLRVRSLRKFTLAEIEEVTNNFDKALMIRKGVFGKVYMGTYYDYIGTEKTEITVAVKCFNPKISGPISERLKLEGGAWAQYSHKNIVSVIGYCVEFHKIFIVYEYMAKGSLANHLCKKETPSCHFSLSWKQCIDICIDVASGLEFMHNARGYSFIHGDVTVTNILLDENGVAKISDLFMIFDENHIASFLDPEYHFTGTINQSSDVYAFGLLVVKILARKLSFPQEDANLGIWFQNHIVNGTIFKIIHLGAIAEIPGHRLEKLLYIAGKCLKTDPEERANMSWVVKSLELAFSEQICRQYSFPEINNMTNNFVNFIGKGGQGKVYKGVTKENITVAVKRFEKDHNIVGNTHSNSEREKHRSEFEREINMVSKLDHSNIVSLLGYCNDSDELILIYEYATNGDLRNALKKRNLSWEQYLSICIGVARGLRNLHAGTNECPKGIIHRDMKPANVLLDRNYVAMISDFGLSKMSLQNQSRSEMETLHKGTPGYIPPEYQNGPVITRKADVWAFGVLLSEVLCGKTPWVRCDSSNFKLNQNYALWAQQNIDPHFQENVDPRLKSKISPKCQEAFTEIIGKCLEIIPESRISMDDVVSKLENAMKWQKHEFGARSCCLLDGGEDRVVLYHTSNNVDSEEATKVFQDSLRVRMLLRRFRVSVDERDTKKNMYAEEFKHVFGDTVQDKALPQMFIRGNHIGGVDVIKRLYRSGELTELLGEPPLEFICEICGEARACDVCNRTVWYMLCKNCDAFTEVENELEGSLRSCPMCWSNELIISTLLELE